MRLAKSFRLLAAAALIPLAACVEVTGPGLEDDSCPVRLVDIGESLPGTLSSYDCVMSDGSATYADYYELRVYSTTWVDLWMDSDHVDPYLVLYDEYDNILAEDDDSLGNLGAWIQVKLNPGIYYIAATTFDVGETGSYLIGVD
jgi:hypothetical protein